MLRWCLGLILALGLIQGATAAAPLSAYGRLPMVEDVAMSAGGRFLALVVTDGEDRYVAVQDLDTGKLLLRSKAGQLRLRDLRFVGETHLIVITQVAAAPNELITRQREWWVGSAIELATGRTRPLMSGVEGAMNVLLATPDTRVVDGETLVLAQGIRFENNVGRASLFELDLARGRTRLVKTGEPETRRWLVGPDGAPLAEERLDPKNGRWSLRVRVDGAWREALSEPPGLDPPTLLGLSPDGAALLFRTSRSDGGWKALTLDGTSRITDFGKRGLVMRDHRTGRVYGAYDLDSPDKRYDLFDPEDAAMWRTVERAFAGSRLALMTNSEDRRRVVVEVDSPTEGLGYALVDRSTKRATWLGEAHPDLTPADISDRRPIRFKAADGFDLPGYLTLPRGREAKALPLIVFPHGGPADLDTARFDWWAQGMASRGYAVLQVNFRGSDGLGVPHLEAGYGQWGRKMQTDLSDGVRHLAGQGLIDPKRVCIVGASYGGYAALAGATLDRGVYRCAVSVAGVSDLSRQIAHGVSGLSSRYWLRFMGAETGSDPVLKSLSPIHLADRADAPILLIHGKDDTVVPADQSQRMADALKKAGKPVELILQKGADHWLSRGDTRLETLTATMAFVEKHNPPN